MRFVTGFPTGFDEDFAAGFDVDFRGEAVVFFVVAADLGSGFLVATF